MESSDLVAAVKSKFRITISDLDTDVTDCVQTSLDLLTPSLKSTIIDESVTLTSSDSSIDISDLTSLDDYTEQTIEQFVDLVSVFIKDSSSDDWQHFTDYSRSGNMIYLRRYLNASVRLVLRAPITDIANVASLPAPYSRVLIDLACAEFCTLLAGDKSCYNIYAQTNGARAVDNMLDLSDFYTNRAERRLNKINSGDYAS